eukprot:TRINITY_DN30160_c0_g1_i1.p1 TRINITY_DN30160_c0_g1~~TRINITY_DN30160_c0_g1_i1.p1  ORF type:complete len:642 (+),score=165.98 TRINITY_DN30160_c0_g1_i1:63-1928(+)
MRLRSAAAIWRRPGRRHPPAAFASGGAQQPSGGAQQPSPYALYQQTVQAAGPVVEFLRAAYAREFGAEPKVLREDFAGTMLVALEWIRGGELREAVAVDSDATPCDWGLLHNGWAPSEEGRLRRAVCRLGGEDDGTCGTLPSADLACALNFSWCCLVDDAALLRYFRALRAAVPFVVLDLYGGPAAERTGEWVMPLPGARRGGRYVWRHARWDPDARIVDAEIDFELPPAKPLRRAFRYHWRLRSAGETRRLLQAAGFDVVTVWAEDRAEDGSGTGCLRPLGDCEEPRGARWTVFISAAATAAQEAPAPAAAAARPPLLADELGQMRAVAEQQDRSPRLVSSALTPESFEADVLPGPPRVIAGATEGWPAHREWQLQRLRERFASESFYFEEERAGGVRRGESLPAVLENLASAAPDPAGYVFDSSFAGAKRELLAEYSVPAYLAQADVFSRLPAELAAHPDRPAWRWFLIGPPGSGFEVHSDPWGSAAWNACIVGHKRWAFMPPSTPPELLRPVLGTPRRWHALDWFREVYPMMRNAPELGMLEFLQRPGEIVFVAPGWHHAVVNLEPTVAVTQNFAGRPSMRTTWAELQRTNAAFAAALQADAMMKPVLRDWITPAAAA